MALTAGAETRLGGGLTLKDATPISKILSEPETYVGNTVQVKGKVTAVCEMMGCWMKLVDDASGQSIRIKVKDGEIVFPKESVGKLAAAEGRFVKIDLTKEQAIARAKHEAEEMGKTFDSASIKGPVSFYQILGTGAIVND